MRLTIMFRSWDFLIEISEPWTLIITGSPSGATRSIQTVEPIVRPIPA